jgi:hypothetical protein
MNERKVTTIFLIVAAVVVVIFAAVFGIVVGLLDNGVRAYQEQDRVNKATIVQCQKEGKRVEQIGGTALGGGQIVCNPK